MKKILFDLSLFSCLSGAGQTAFKDSLQKYIDNYVKKHEVVKGEDKKHLQFFPVSNGYQVKATVKLQPSSQWFKMDASGPIKQLYRVYGVASFLLNGKEVRLSIYQNQQLVQTEDYADYLFIPFTDATSGKETYEGGRYLDIRMSEIKNNTLVLDFNKAYNPYCAYASGIFSCPIPPAATA
jgi:uncharacterized protein (DUF1684 family)